MDKYSYEIKKGYCFFEKHQKMDIWQARDVLLSKRQRLYVEARRSGAYAELVGRYLKCPYCDEEYAVNSRSMYDSKGNRMPAGKGLEKEKIIRWADTQLSLFDDVCDSDTLTISKSVTNFAKFYCPKCKRISGRNNSVHHAEVLRKKKKVIVKSEIANISEIFAMNWIESETISIAFPMYEIIVFDCYKGKIYIKLEDEKENLVAQRNITGLPHLIKGSAVWNTIEAHKLVNRTVKKMFGDIWSEKLPFQGKKFTMENIFKMTMFVDYPKSFYRCIPYELESINVEKSFRGIARKMNNSRNVIQMFTNSKLPQVKSVKKVFFDKLGLFFYLNEAELLWDEINDYNLFCKLIESDTVFSILSFIHSRAGIMCFIKDYCRIKGSKSFVKKALCSWNVLASEAIEYATMSDRLKHEMQKRWRTARNGRKTTGQRTFYSIPMHKPDESIKDCSINGYDFFWLITSKDYAVASKKLNNCLGSLWTAEDSPVVCVKKGDEYVAAIEINKRKIIQAQGYNNRPIQSDKELYNAYKIWLKNFAIHQIE